MKYKTTLFYPEGPDSKFLTFSNYTDSLTGSFLSTNNKLYPTGFLALNIPGIDDAQSKSNFISQYLTGYYENKLAFLREAAIFNNLKAEDFICPLNILFECVNQWNKNEGEPDTYDPINRPINIVYAGDVTEQDYNGVYADTICTLDLNNATKGEVEYTEVNLDENALVATNDHLHGWSTDELATIDSSNQFAVYKEMKPIYDKIDSTDPEYYTEADAIAYNAGLPGAIQPHTVKENLQSINFSISYMLPNGQVISGVDFSDCAEGTFDLIEYVEGENINYYKVKINNITWKNNDPQSQLRRNLNWISTGGRDKYFYIIEGSQNMPNHSDMNLLYDSIDDLPVKPNDIGSPSPFTLQNVNEPYHSDTNQVVVYLRTADVIDNIILYTEEDANEYNGRLNGAVQEGDVKPLTGSGDSYYYTKSDISGINLSSNTDDSITFNAIILLYDMVDITENNLNTSSILENGYIDLSIDTASNILYNRYAPYGIWISDNPITISKDYRTNLAPVWSLSVLSQFKPLPYNNVYNINATNSSTNGTEPSNVDLTLAEQRANYTTFTQVLARQNEIIDKYEEVIKKYNNSITTQLDTLGEAIERYNGAAEILNTFKNTLTELANRVTELENRIEYL